jgi:hypothetical protein
MLFKLKKVLFIFLALLQLVAPLVHAHAGEKSLFLANSGSSQLHIPGLESYGIDFDASMIEAHSSQIDAEGIVIRVDDGIKQHQAKLIADVDNNYFIPQQSKAFEQSVSLFDVNFSPRLPVLVFRHLNTSHTPRAPPAQ